MPHLPPHSLSFNIALRALCVTALLLLPLTYLATPLQSVSNSYLDWLTRQRASQQSADPRLVIIDIDDLSLQAMAGEAGQWPWPRSLHAELLEYLLAQKPQAVVFDILFSEPDRFRPDADAYFAEVLSKTDKVYLAALEQKIAPGNQAPLLRDYPAQAGLSHSATANPEQRGLLLLPSALPATLWQTGSINFSADPDGVGRSYDLYRQLGDWRLPSLPAKVASDLGADLPTSASIRLDWPSTDSAYPMLSYAAVLAQARGEAGALPAHYFHNKIILIGTTASGLHDLRRTPMAHLHPALLILATAIDNLLNQQQLHSVASLWNLTLGLSLLGVASLLILRKRLLQAVLFSALLSALLLAGSYLMALNGQLLDVVPNLSALWLLLSVALVVFYLRRQQQLRNTIALFSRFMDPVVVNQLVANEDPRALLASRDCELTVLFSDIRGFTTLSEKHTAVEIMQILEQYFSTQVSALFKYHATLDKFIGDAIMAFWGAPLDNPTQATDSINAALEMLDNVERFKRDFGYPDFDIGIGIHTGNAVVGMVGASQRYDYTAIGDTVNLASRIEGLTKGRARLLVSAATMQACADQFDFIAHGDCQVKGRVEPVALFEPRRKSNE